MATQITISSGTTSNGLSIGSNVLVNVYGVASNFKLQTSGAMTVFGGGSAVGTEVANNASLFVSSGGFLSNTPVLDGAEVNGFAIHSNSFMVTGVALVDVVVNSGAVAYLFNGQNASGVNMSAGGSLFVSSGGSIANLQVNSGAEIRLMDGAITSDISLQSGAVFNGFIIESATQDVFGISNTFTNISALVNSGRSVVSAVVSEGGNVSVTSHGILSSAQIQGTVQIFNGGLLSKADNSGTLYVNGGTAILIEQNGLLNVSSGGLVSGVTQFAGGSMNVDNSGFVSSAVISDGSVVISAGGSMNTVTMTGGSMHVSSGAIENFDFTNAYVSVGHYFFSNHFLVGAASGLVSSATIGSGGTMVAERGALLDVTVANNGSLFMGIGNTVKNLLISSGAVVSAGNYIDVASKTNNFSNTTILSGGVMNGFTALDSNVMVSGIIHRNVAVYSAEGPAELLHGEQVDHGFVKSEGTIHLSSGLTAAVSDLTVESGGNIHVEEDAVLVLNGKTTLNNGGGITLDRYIVHYADKYLTWSAVVSHIPATSCYSPVSAVSSGMIVSGGSAVSVEPVLEFASYTQDYPPASFFNGQLFVPEGASVTTTGITDHGSQAKIRFDFTGSSLSNTLAPNEAMLSDISRVTIHDTGVDSSTLSPNQYHDDPRFEFIYTSDLKDAYFLADGAEGFGYYPSVYNETFRIVDSSGRALVSSDAQNQQLNVDGNIGSWIDGGVTVSARLQKEHSHLYMELYRDDDTANAEITITPSLTAYTNADVVVTAQYSQNTQFGTKQYSVDGGTSWQDYKVYDGVVFDRNGTVTFRGTGADGTAVTKNMTVDWIDKIKPTIEIAQDATEQTLGGVTLTATVTDLASDEFAASGLDTGKGIQYSFTGDDWQQYTDAGVVVDHNCDVFFRAWDNAGNEGTLTHTVTNILSSTEKPEVFSVSPETPTNGDVTITVIFDINADFNEYSVDGKNYKTLTASRYGTYVAAKNETVYFRSHYAAGIYSDILSYEVTNIDKVAPAAPVVTVDSEDIVQSLTMTAEYHEEDSVKEYSVNNTNWIEYTEPLTILANGTWYFRETDAVGNVSPVTSRTITNIAVSDAPAAEISPSTYTVNSVHINVSPVTGSAQPMIYQYRYLTDPSKGTWSVWTDFNQADGFNIDQNYTDPYKTDVQIRAVRADNKNYSSPVTSISVTNIDRTAPEIPDVAWDDAWTPNPVTVYVAGYDSQSGVASMEYQFNGGAWTAFSTEAEGHFEVMENGIFKLRATDKLGNQKESGKTYSISKIDNVSPLICDVAWNSGVWMKGSVTVYVASYDSLSGVVSMEYQLNGGAWTAFSSGAEGHFDAAENGSFKLRATDQAGNQTESGTYTITNIDNVNPLICDVAWNSGVWTTNPVTVYVAGYDSQSGVASMEYQLNGGAWTAFSSGAEGHFDVADSCSFKLRATDNVGNRSESGAYSITNIDKSGPVIYAVDWNGVWTTGSVKVYTAIFDTQSGVASTEYQFNGGAWTAFTDTFDITDNGSFKIRATDNMGNQTESGAYTITNIDKTAPVIYAVDWNGELTKDPVTVYTAIFDTQSGVASTEYQFNGGAWTAFTNTFNVEENGIFTIRATDNVGNVATASGMISNITRYTFSRDPGVKSEVFTVFAYPAGVYLFSGDFGNVSGTITVTNNNVAVSGTIRQGVLKIGTDNMIALTTDMTTIEVDVQNGSLYQYTINLDKWGSASASSPMLFGEELEDAAGLLQEGAAASSLVQLDVDTAVTDFAAAGFDDALKSVAVESALTALNGSDVYSGVDTDLDQFSKLNAFSTGLLAG